MRNSYSVIANCPEKILVHRLDLKYGMREGGCILSQLPASTYNIFSRTSALNGELGAFLREAHDMGALLLDEHAAGTEIFNHSY
jgi:hypothetical protein